MSIWYKLSVTEINEPDDIFGKTREVREAKEKILKLEDVPRGEILDKFLKDLPQLFTNLQYQKWESDNEWRNR